jgi:Asp-tRNA(Asn)/Glu-tRNA(Gln) amidotransferase A subunit family amidase
MGKLSFYNPVQDGAEADKQNPYILDHNPCGSSAGSAVAVAANLCVVAVGTETDGSVVSSCSKWYCRH